MTRFSVIRFGIKDAITNATLMRDHQKQAFISVEVFSALQCNLVEPS